MHELRFFNPYADIHHTSNRLPQWQQDGAVYFVTFRLADAVPTRLLSRWESDREVWLRFHPEPWTKDMEREYHRRFSQKIETWLDAGHGACHLKKPVCASVLANVLRYFDGLRILMISFVIMPNHAHTLFVLNPEWSLEKLMLSWKRFSAREINKLLVRSGALWQKDYFDRLVRDDSHFANCVRYIRRNPEKALLKADEYVLYESEIARHVPLLIRAV